MKKSLIIEIILFVVLLGVCGYLGTKIFKHTFDIGKKYHIEFHDINGIVVGSPVRILGVDIGNVTKITTKYDTIYVDFVVTNEDVTLPPGTTATIASFGIAGSRSLELTPPKKDSPKEGLIAKDPLRLGDAFSIMEKFLRATLMSIGGLYEFAKDKTQDEVGAMAGNFLKKTNQTNAKLDYATYKVEEGGAKFHKSLTGTTNGMQKFYDTTHLIDFNKTINYSRYAINLTKRSLIQFHHNIEDFNQKTEECSSSINLACENISSIPINKNVINNIDASFKATNDAMQALDKNLTQENIDNVFDKLDNLRLFSEKLNENF